MNALICVLFPSILYGQILIGTGTSRYETVFTLSAKKATRATLTLYTDKGEPMDASFVDERGNTARTGSSFEVFLAPERPIKLKLALTADEAGDDVAVKTGWATFRSPEEIEVTAIVRITTADGRLIQRHVLPSEKPAVGAIFDRPGGQRSASAIARSLRDRPPLQLSRALDERSDDFYRPLPHQLPLLEFVAQSFVRNP